MKITGTREPRDEKTRFLMKEIYDADFSQTYVLDQTIDRGKIHASLQKGVLNLKLGVKETEKPRKIQVVEK
jgi:HSP20 family molecular chaperone IbpA